MDITSSSFDTGTMESIPEKRKCLNPKKNPECYGIKTNGLSECRSCANFNKKCPGFGIKKECFGRPTNGEVFCRYCVIHK